MQLKTAVTAGWTTRKFEALAHISSWIAVLLTVVMVPGVVAESNPFAEAIMDHIGMLGFAVLAPLLISFLYRLIGRYGDHMAWSFVPAVFLTADAIGNIAGVMVLGAPDDIPTRLVVGAAIGGGFVAIMLYSRPLDRLNHRAGQTGTKTRSRGRIRRTLETASKDGAKSAVLRRLTTSNQGESK